MTFKQPERSSFESHITREQALELSPSMQQLVQNPAWKVLEDVLTGYRVQAREQALEGEESGFQFWKGFVAGMKAAQDTPRDILEAATKVAQDEEARGRQPRVRLADVEDAASADATF